MAEIAVQYLISSLRELLVNHLRLRTDVRNQIAKIESDLHLINAFLRDYSTMTRRKDQRHQEFIREIRDVVYEAEDIIDDYVTQAADMESRNYFRRAFSKSTNLNDISQKLQSVFEKIQTSAFNAANFNNDNDHEWLDEITQAPRIIGKNVVGLEDEKEKVIGYLNEESNKLDVIAIVGMPGIGKTTLAWKTFHSPEMIYQFPTRIWIHVSNNFIERDVFLVILKNFMRITDDITHKSDEELAKLAAANLEETSKFLIVMDDVWSTRDWDRLRVALPESKTKGKVLITSCNEKVGRHANRLRPPHKVRFLTQTESWFLLQSEVFGGKEYPHELETLGKLIVEQCEGLPLAILAMARTLVEEDMSYSDTTEKKIGWTKAGFRVPQFRNDIFYRNLPHRLRLCFLYFGMFPYDIEIPVWKLIRMWIAEGLILPNGGISLEETAETYLGDLISRNLVAVGRIKSDGLVKTCRVHRMIHEFCKTEAGNERENFLQEIKFSDGVCEPRVSQLSNYRRLCIHSNVLRFLSSNISCPRVRSLVCFSKENAVLPAVNTSAILNASEFIRVLDVNPIKFTKTPRDIFKLRHLRYLVISLIDISFLPSIFSKPSKIQTLVVDTTSRTLEFKGDMMDMAELRHFKTNASTILARHGKTSQHGQQLQTLGTISPASCTEELLDRARNLKKLGIRGQLSAFFDGNTGSFDSLAKLENLENMKLLNDVFPNPPPEGRLHSLRSAYKFPPRLKSLTLASTFLDWSEMNILGSLERLTVLKLKDNAFVGRNWVTHDPGFDRLEALHIEHTDLVIWVASAQQFPRLRRLQLHNCEQLWEVPFQLVDIPSLQHLELFNSKLAAASAHRIGDEIIKQRKYQEGPSNNAKEFKLSVFPNE